MKKRRRELNLDYFNKRKPIISLSYKVLNKVKVLSTTSNEFVCAFKIRLIKRVEHGFS